VSIESVFWGAGIGAAGVWWRENVDSSVKMNGNDRNSREP